MKNIDIREAEELAVFEKIRKKNKRHFGRRNELNKFTNEQIPGSVHPIEDSKVRFDQDKRKDYKDGKRPGCISISPSKDTNYISEWVPFSTKLNNRNDNETVLLLSNIEKVKEDCVALIRYRDNYVCSTLGIRISKLSDEKTNEILDKIAKYTEEGN